MLNFVSSFFASSPSQHLGTAPIEEIAIPSGVNFMAATDAELEKYRAIIRNGLAKAELYQRRVRELERQIAALESSLDNSADQHVSGAAGLQSELQEIQQKQLVEINSRRAADPAIETRRQELLSDLAARNAALESRAETTRKQIAILTEEANRLRMTIARSAALPIMLRATAPAALHARLKAASCGAEWAAARERAAKKGLAECEESIRIDREQNKRAAGDWHLRVAERHLLEWQAEVSAATAARAVADEALAEVQKAIENE